MQLNRRATRMVLLNVPRLLIGRWERRSRAQLFGECGHCFIYYSCCRPNPSPFTYAPCLNRTSLTRKRESFHESRWAKGLCFSYLRDEVRRNICIELFFFSVWRPASLVPFASNTHAKSAPIYRGLLPTTAPRSEERTNRPVSLENFAHSAYKAKLLHVVFL